MTDGPPRLLRGFTRHRDHLDDLFRGKGGRRSQARVVGHDLRDHRGQCFIAQFFRFHLCQRRGKGEPTMAPHAHGPTVEVHLACHLAVVGSSIHRQQELGTPHQTLGIGLTACDLLHAGTLSGRERDGRGYRCSRRNGRSHTGFLSSEFWNIRPI